MFKRQTRNSVTMAIALAASLLGCGDTSGPEFRLQLEFEGRLERSAEVEAVVTFQGDAVPPTDISWSADPEDAVEFLSAQRLRFLAAGPVTLAAEAELESGIEQGRATLDVAVPPLVVFDLSREGNRDIYSVELDGQRLTRLTESAGDDVDPSAAAGAVVFTSFRDGNGELYSVPLGGGVAQRLTQTEHDEIQTALSPDGSRIAYMTDPGGVFRLWVAQSDGSDPLPLTSGFGIGGSVEASPGWDPTGEEIVFVSTTNGTADVFTLRPGGDPASLVVSDDAEVEPAWSPDGDRVVFASDRAGDTELFLISLTTEGIIRLTQRLGPDGEPAWLPDGRIVYTAWVDNTPTLRWLDPESPGATFEIPVGTGSPRRPSGVPN
ncbi:MAG: hypothetical protein PVJ64_02330 [Gemmatimonadales bacterium]|jgi:TolB protein